MQKLLTLIVLLVFLLVPLESSVQVAHAGLGIITEIIDSAGDGANGLANPFDIAVDAVGNVYVAGAGSNNAFKITPGGTITEIITSAGDGGGNTLDNPNGIAVDAAGNVYVTGQISNNAFKITPGGTITEIIDSAGDGANGLSFAIGIAVDAAGNVYVTGIGSINAFKITPGGTITEIIDGTGDGVNGLTSPLSIAVDAASNVYVTGSNNAFKIDTPGTCSTGGTACTITEIIDGTGDGVNVLSAPFGIAVDAAGNVYVAGLGSINAFKITIPGTCSTGGTPCTITEIIDSAGDGANVLTNPRGIAVDTAGNVYVSGFNSDNAFKITPGGIIDEIIDSAGDGVNVLENPQGVAVDAAGNVYVTGFRSDNAFKLESPASCGTKTVLNTEGQCVPDLSQVCGAGTIPHFDLLMCFGQMAVGGIMIPVDAVALLLAAIGIDPLITGLLVLSMIAVSAQLVWILHKKKISNKP